jgi:translation initiation factor 2A
VDLTPELRLVSFGCYATVCNDHLTFTDKEGPIHDVAWSSNSKEFGVVYGFMPAKTTIFNSKAQATHSFALGPRNTIAFSPHGRFVLVAGFGNLAGQVDIYDLSKNFNKVCTIEASNASICEWSPDGSHILFATTSPRLRVDNGIRIFHVGGGLIYSEEINELYHVCWRPQSTDMHPLPVDPLNVVPEPHESAKAYLAKSKSAVKPTGAYRPPGARGTTTPLHFKREDEGGAAYVSNGQSGFTGPNGFGKPRRREVPGAEPVDPSLPPGAAPGGGVSLAGATDGADEGLSKAALKNKKKREAKKAKEAAEREKNLNAAAGQGVEGAPKAPRAMSSSPSRQQGPHHRRNRSGYEHAPHHGRSPHRQPGNNNNHQQYPNRPAGYNHQPRNQPRQPRGSEYFGNEGATASPSSSVPIDANNITILTSPSSSSAGTTAPPNIAPASAPDVTVTSPGGGGSSHEKKVRSLLKKLRAIEELKMRQAGGERLEATQVQKITTEEVVKRELDALNAEAGG